MYGIVSYENRPDMKSSAALLMMLLVSLYGQTPKGVDIQADRLSTQEQRGKEIYLGIEGQSGSELKAFVGNPRIEVPASLVACVNCHGENGKGVLDGMVPPADITWRSLTNAFTAAQSSGRSRPAYTERMLIRAIGLGIDSAGKQLNPTMPRYGMSREDSAALISYLKRLRVEPEKRDNKASHD